MDAFDDGKEPGALRTIGEVAGATGIKSHVLRYWEAQFPMLKPLTRSGGRRYYRPEDIALVKRIDRLVNREGYTLKGAKAVLKGGQPALKGGPGEREIAESVQSASGTPAGSDLSADFLPRLKSIRDDLKRALAA